MARLSVAFIVFVVSIVSQSASAAPSTVGPSHSPAQVNGDVFNFDLDGEVFGESANLTAREQTWGHTFNATEWGLTDDDFLSIGDDDYMHGNSTASFWDDEHELQARGKTPPKKIGLAFDWASPINPGAWKSSRVRAAYNWDTWKPKGLPSNIPYWPMLHRPELTKNWLATCQKGYAGVALGFNEPDHPSQANMNPQQGAALWRKFMLPLKARGYRLLSPAVTSAPSGVKWLKEWKRQCPSCWKSIDGLALHYYGKSASGMQQYIANMHKTFNKPIHVTETACEDFSPNKCSAAQAERYMNDVTGWALKTDYVHSIFYFGMWPADKMPGNVGRSNSLMAGNGTPNAFGKKYLKH